MENPRTTTKNRSLSSLLCSFLHSPVTLSLLGPNILLSTIMSNTLSWGRRSVRFKFILQNWGDFVDVILLYIGQFHCKALQKLFSLKSLSCILYIKQHNRKVLFLQLVLAAELFNKLGWNFVLAVATLKLSREFNCELTLIFKIYLKEVLTVEKTCESTEDNVKIH